jgi:hypothetical protein
MFTSMWHRSSIVVPGQSIHDHDAYRTVFDTQYNTYMSYGYAVDPTSNQFIGDTNSYEARDGTRGTDCQHVE